MTEPDRLVVLAGQDVARLRGDHLLRGTTWHYKAALRSVGLLGVDAPLGEYDLTPLVRVASGIMFPGVCWDGPDVGQYPQVDRSIQDLVRLGVQFGLPMMAICGGAQQVVMAAGGRLVRVEGHCPPEPGYLDVAVRVAASANLGTTELHEKEMHTLGVGSEAELGAGLRAIGWAPDGQIEMFMLSDGRELAGHLDLTVSPAILDRLWIAGAFTHPEMAADHPLLQDFARACRAVR
jgi:Peptidase C26